MSPRRIDPADISDYLPARGQVWLHACSAESALFRQGIEDAARDLSGLDFSGIFLPGLNDVAHILHAGAGLTTFFATPALVAQRRCRFLPLGYRGIRQYYGRNVPDAALVMLAPPDRDGVCSFGPVTDLLADLWQRIPILIAHVNPRMPATRGTPGIPYDRLTAVIEAEQELLVSDPGTDSISERIAAFAAGIIPDGATIQTGLGRAPESVLRGLTGLRGLSIFSGLTGDSALHLLEAGALRRDQPITTGVAFGTRRLYDAIGSASFSFRPPSHTHDHRVLTSQERYVAINSALEVDLYGSIHSELTPRGLNSGPGGLVEVAAGARGLDDLRIVVLPSTAKGGAISRIVAAGQGSGPPLLGRLDTDIVITEHGAADLRLKTHEARAEALVAIAAPGHRAALERSWPDAMPPLPG